jgi:cell wall-associated NlpC family hydrolase
MVKQILPAIGLILCLSSCTAFKSLNLPGSKAAAASSLSSAAPTENKFLDDITVTAKVDNSSAKPDVSQALVHKGPAVGEPVIHTREEEKTDNRTVADHGTGLENASSVQLKYAVLLNTEVESLPSKVLLESVDEWYGVRYRTGGNTKSGVDCSGFTVAVYAAVYGITLPRVSRDQYRTSRKVSTTELQEGDLVFFNTRGSGVSHVGIYLGNNRFIHASVSRGVMVSSLFEPYYLQRFVGGGRIDEKQVMARN